MKSEISEGKETMKSVDTIVRPGLLATEERRLRRGCALTNFPRVLVDEARLVLCVVSVTLGLFVSVTIISRDALSLVAQ